MAITQTISNFPPAPDSQTDTPSEFNAKADAFVHHQADTYTTEVNSWATQANGLKGDMNIIKTDIDGIVANIPAGTINDSTTTATSVWSSQKVVAYNGGIESGYKGGAAWSKFPDGTLIVSRSGGLPFRSGGASGSLFYGAEFNVNFIDYSDIAFKTPPSITVQWQDSVFTNNCIYIQLKTSTSSAFAYRPIGSTDKDADGSMLWIAVGRWK